MSELPRIGFVGFGVVGRVFSQAMHERGACVAYFDVLGESTAPTPARYLPLPELVASSDVLISTVVTNAALQAASQVAGLLRPPHTYVDFNSTSPSLKVKIAEVVAPSGAGFVEGAILSPVGASGAQSVILLSGPSAEAMAETLRSLGLPNVKYLSPRYGEASTVKMLRSIFSKGVECLLLEMLAAGRRAGIDDYLWRDIMDFMDENRFQKLAENWIKSHVSACDRRWHEMSQVVETLEELGVAPVMARATESFYGRSVALQPGKEFGAGPTVDGVVGFFAERIGEAPPA